MIRTTLLISGTCLINSGKSRSGHLLIFEVTMFSTLLLYIIHAIPCQFLIILSIASIHVLYLIILLVVDVTLECWCHLVTNTSNSNEYALTILKQTSISYMDIINYCRPTWKCILIRCFFVTISHCKSDSFKQDVYFHLLLKEWHYFFKLY